ncbi:MAG: sigma-70 family RNA polymerase sigma factor [Acidovorax sp.]|nr:MAG: sigma-70 family RNA polymerase sigma factor [Acidovorax sp.]
MHDEHRMALIDTDRSRLVRAATRLLGPAEAEDAVQDAYIRALEADTRELNTAQAWLLTVVRHLAIDRLRRRQWIQQWLAEAATPQAPAAAPSAESDAALAEEVAHALRQLAACLSPAEGAAVLLYEVFEASHAEIASASGRTEAASRQHIRRALNKLRQAAGRGEYTPAQGDSDGHDPAVLRVYLQSLQWRDPQTLWSMLRQPPISASSLLNAGRDRAITRPATTSMPTTSCGVVQVGGQLGLVLTLDGVALCVLPLGLRNTERDLHAALQ